MKNEHEKHNGNPKVSVVTSRPKRKRTVVEYKRSFATLAISVIDYGIVAILAIYELCYKPL